jgi:hypothetical protein
MRKDPIVAEVREAREQVLSRFDNDLAAYVEHLKLVGAQKRARGVKYVEVPVRTTIVVAPDAA